MVRSRGGSSSQGGRDKGKMPMVEEEPSRYPPLNEFQDEHRTRCFSEPDNKTAISQRGFRYKQYGSRQHELDVRWDDRFESFFIHASLLQANRIGHIPINGLLITAMQERWRKETHTFHMPHGEMTITLEDVLCIMGMRVDGQPLCKNNSVIDWADKAEHLLGKRPSEEMFRGTEKKRSKILVRKKWFKANFNDLGECEPDERIEQYCRAYMLAFFTDVLFTDPNRDCYSLMPLLLLENMQELDKWSFGSGVLAYLYRELCKSVDVGRKNMGGCVLLLQLWVWHHFSTGRPTVSLAVDRLTTNANFPDRNDTVGMLWANVTQKDFKKPETNLWANRDMLDSQPPTDVFWTPYEIYRERLPPICNHERGMSRLRQPLIYFWIVERYRPDRVRRQFGFRQVIPPEITEAEKKYDKELHKKLNGRGDNWPRVHEIPLQSWRNRLDDAEPEVTEPFNPNDVERYMRWYWRNSDPLVQTTIPHGSSVYRPMVPDKRLTAKTSMEGARIGFRLLQRVRCEHAEGSQGRYTQMVNLQ